METYKLFLDDIRVPRAAYLYMGITDYAVNDWEVVKNYDEFVNIIQKNFENGMFPELISFDHDLADEHYRESMMNDPEKYNGYYDSFKEKTGLDCAKWLVDFCMDNDLELPKYYVHSMNPVGRQNILSYLNNFSKFQKNN